MKINNNDILSSSFDGGLNIKTMGCIDPIATNYVCVDKPGSECAYIGLQGLNEYDYYIYNSNCSYVF